MVIREHPIDDWQDRQKPKTCQIGAYALDIGYTHVGITPADNFHDPIEEVASRGDLYDFYSQDPRRFMDGARPRDTMPGAKSIIRLAWDYAQKAFPEALLGKIGRIYQARCYGPPAHRINGARYRLMPVRVVLYFNGRQTVHAG